MAIILISFSIRCVEIMIETIRDGQQRVIFQRWRNAQRMRNADPCTSHIMITKLVLAGGRPSWQIGCEAISLTSICILRRWRRIEPAIQAIEGEWSSADKRSWQPRRATQTQITHTNNTAFSMWCENQAVTLRIYLCEATHWLLQALTAQMTDKNKINFSSSTFIR